MEQAKAIWEELGLPALKPEMPWYGYSLGQWPEEFQSRGRPRGAQRILEDRRRWSKAARNDKRMNDPYLSL